MGDGSLVGCGSGIGDTTSSACTEGGGRSESSDGSNSGCSSASARRRLRVSTIRDVLGRKKEETKDTVPSNG